jgi:hypothetical protein
MSRLANGQCRLRGDFVKRVKRVWLLTHKTAFPAETSQALRQIQDVLPLRSHSICLFQVQWRSEVACYAGGLWQTARRGGMANPRFFHRKMRGVKTGASSSTAMDNAAPAEFTPSIDRKKGRFLGLFCR